LDGFHNAWAAKTCSSEDFETINLMRRSAGKLIMKSSVISDRASMFELTFAATPVRFGHMKVIVQNATSCCQPAHTYVLASRSA
jgi:citrate lyase alpha subunit